MFGLLYFFGNGVVAMVVVVNDEGETEETNQRSMEHGEV